MSFGALGPGAASLCVEVRTLMEKQACLEGLSLVLPSIKMRHHAKSFGKGATILL